MDEATQELRRQERAFAQTELGKLFCRFENAHALAWQADSQEHISDRRLREVWDAANKARQEFVAALMKIAPKPEVSGAVLHKDGDPRNNDIGNLEVRP